MVADADAFGLVVGPSARDFTGGLLETGAGETEAGALVGEGAVAAGEEAGADGALSDL